MATQWQTEFDDVIKTGPFAIRFPRKGDLNQDEEWCEVEIDGEWRRVRFHDYDEVYDIPGLYETIFYRTLRCNSPTVVAGLLQQVLTEQGVDPTGLRVLDVGAGNGMVGEALHNLGSRHIIGIDLLPEAERAARRDRPWVYNEYFATDLTQLKAEEIQALEAARLNLLATVAALGFGDIPPEAFRNAFNFIEDGGFAAFNIKEDFLRGDHDSPFARLIHNMTEHGVIQMEMYKRYCHRLSIAGEPLYYIAVIAQKMSDAPESLLET